ncbi:urease accessory protein UreF [Hydrogenophaga sp. 5NK40-0174]|uniref:urease accessory protein UreF n=1 Tax=Hydrogenophaga sp. 5NK40-0174 TaxID=3127649 RepID=UPI00333E9428
MAQPPATSLGSAALLRLLCLSSPTLPVGGFSYSEGLEAAIDKGFVEDEASAATWLIDQLHLSLARADLAVVAQAITAWQADDHERIQDLNQWVLRTRETQEFRLQSEQMGRSLQEWARSLGALGAGLHDRLTVAQLALPTYPVVFACAVTVNPMPLADALTAYAFAWSENLVQAAIKGIPLGQSAGQRILARLMQEIPSAVDHAASCTDATRQSFTPMLALLSAQHETQYSRLFRS